MSLILFVEFIELNMLVLLTISNVAFSFIFCIKWETISEMHALPISWDTPCIQVCYFGSMFRGIWERPCIKNKNKINKKSNKISDWRRFNGVWFCHVYVCYEKWKIGFSKVIGVSLYFFSYMTIVVMSVYPKKSILIWSPEGEIVSLETICHVFLMMGSTFL